MQSDHKDLQKEWKERSARKKIYLEKASAKNSLINFAEYTKSTSRTEMPNKYNISIVPKIEIERVYQQNLLRKSKSISGGIPSAPVTAIEAPSPSQKPFYYCSNNEILSMEEFLQVHKAVKGYQKKQEKILFHQTMMDRRSKIEEVYTERGISTARRPSDQFSLSIGRPISSQFSRKFSASQLARPTTARPNTARNPMENILLDQTNLSQVTPKTVGSMNCMTDRARKLRKGLSLKTNFDINLAGIEDTTSTVPETTRIQPNSARGFTTNQKFTEKEIMKHLMRGTVSPKPPKYGGKGVLKEKTYNRMFRGPKTMDLAIEATIKKATKIVVNEDQKTSVLRTKSPDFENRELGLGIRGHSSRKDLKTSKVSEVPITPFESEGNKEGDQTVADMIKSSVKNISVALSTTTPRLLVGIFGDNDEPKTERKKGRTLLRAEVEQKYEFSKHLEQNRMLSDRIKNVTKALKKELPLSSMNNQNYVEFFN